MSIKAHRMCINDRLDWARPYVVLCGKFYDSREKKFKVNEWFVVDAGDISKRGNGEPPTTNLPTLNLSNYLITPGLMDGHCHLMLPGDGGLPDSYITHATGEHLAAVVFRNLLKASRAGVTAVCDVGSMGTNLLGLRTFLEKGPALVPRVIAAGAPLTPTGGHMAYFGGTADTLKELFKKARTYRSRGAEILKVVGNGGGTVNTRSWVSYYDESDLRELVSEAHAYDQVAAIHANHLETIRKAVAAGFDSLEHCTFATGSNQFEVDPELVAAIAEQEIWVSPTLSAVHGYIDVMRERLPNLNPKEKTLFNNISQAQEHNFRTAERLNREGVKLFIGTDAGWRFCQFGDYHLELGFFHHIGLSIEDVLYAATLGVAKARGAANRMGSLQEGTLADFAVFSLPPEIRPIKFPLSTEATFVGGFPIFFSGCHGIIAQQNV